MNLEEPKAWPWFKPDGNPRPEWRLFFAATWDAARDAVRDAARDAALDAALDAAWYAALDAARYATLDAALDAARDATLDAARYAATDAARDAATDAATDAARDAAWDAAWDVALLHGIETVTPHIAPMHVDHARSRVEVWQKGYALLCEVNGVLYVYAAAEVMP